MSDNYEDFQKEYLRLSGIDLTSYKENQMKRRIESFMEKYETSGYDNFLKLLKSDSEVYDKFITYLTINVSEFYRNPAQWQILEKEILPELMQKFGKRIKIWSAACSTGDEPYSLAMVLSDFMPLNQIQIIATDLDNEVLAKAKKGYYSEKSIQGLPKKYQDRFIERDKTGIVKVSDELRSCITFKQHDLLKDPYPQDIHIIVCRNVTIYFTEEAKQRVYTNFASALPVGGYLFVGSTEQIIGASKYGFQSVKSFFYKKQ
ncbi:MAG: protein-glutamate O-methyltransferase CheR [Lachnospiraceae bacterium]|nr:protein-glutamate O-methyltransferase CheR [Lachnospiraceae bacterium]